MHVAPRKNVTVAEAARRHQASRQKAIHADDGHWPLNITMVQAMAIVKHIGIGSAETLRGADLRLPGGA